MTAVRVPAIKPLYNTTEFGNMLIEIGKRINGPTGEYYRRLDNIENVLRHLARGFADNPGDNGVNSYESLLEKGVWYKKPYHWEQRDGVFYEWDGEGHNREMTEEEVQAKLLKTGTGKFELFNSSYLEKHADYIVKKLGIRRDRVGFAQWIEPQHTGGSGDLHFVTPKVPNTAEGRSANIPQATAAMHPSVGGKDRGFLEMHPDTARARGIRDGDRVRISSDIGSIEAYVRYVPQNRPDVVVLPFEFGHWAGGRWATGQDRDILPGNANEITANVSEPISGLAAYSSGKVVVTRA